MPLHQFRLAEGVDEPRVALGARNVDVVFGTAAPGTDEVAVDVYETEDEEVAGIFAGNSELLSHSIVSEDTGAPVSPEDYAVEAALHAERERVEQLEAEGRAEAEKAQSAPTSVGADPTGAAREAVTREQWLERAATGGISKAVFDDVSTEDLPAAVLATEDAQR